MKAPTFAAKHELARWIHEDDLGKGGRISSAAFMPIEGEAYLSVNAVELESLSTIAAYYRNTFQRGTGKVAISCIKVVEYNRASNAGGVVVNRDAKLKRWVFEENGKKMEAFRHRPSHRPSHKSASHCGVETVRLMNEDASAKFARRLAGCPPRKNPHFF